MNNVSIFENKDFPIKLKNIKNSPERLYLLGNKNLIFEESIAVVGTRNISEYGIMCLHKIVKGLVEKDICITSGMAKGTDALAHKLALDFNTKTIAVLGGGFDYIYPKENIELFNDILENNGLIVSEYPPEEKYKSKYFPKRNRIISAISEGVLVIEATYRSGTSITAKYAKEQGKKVFAIPGRIDSKNSFGTNEIIKKGGIITTESEDILNVFPQFINKKGKNTIKKEIFYSNDEDNFKNEHKKIIQLLKDMPCTIDEIICRTKIERENVLDILFELQLEGIVEKRIGDGYKLKIK